MKLSQIELDDIARYLEAKGLYQVDIKNEVLDHMANDIEMRMQEDGLSFIDAFEVTRKAWSQELMPHSSFWIGLIYVGPKIAIKKCAARLKKSYTRTLLAALALFALSYGILSMEAMFPFYDRVTQGIGYLYLVAFASFAFFYFRIYLSKMHTTYRYLYKVNVFGFAIAYLYFNPLVATYNNFHREGEIQLLSLFLHSFLLIYFYTAIDLFRAHHRTVALNTIS
ncbi:hypothetical protein [Spongiimicrobium salis]|uniref:hypothetical protein n=1 Tax=Spongiimicrobium salis TaxID=1667022 RepID=UPI00374C946B